MIPPAEYSQPLRHDHSPVIGRFADGLAGGMGFTKLRAACIDCAGPLESIFDAEPDARSARRRVECDQRTEFTIAPVALFDGAVR